MARQRQSRRSAPAPQKRQAHTTARPPPPPQSMTPTQQHPPAVQQQPQQRQPGLFGQMASTAAGVAVGSTIGHTMAGGISSMFGGRGSEPAEQAQEAPQDYQQQTYQASAPGQSACETDARQFTKCLEQNNNNVSACQWYLENLKACQQMASNY